ncbi:MAG: TonB-dependent receptor [Rhodospirillales bacterium]|nr:TonB-dependent receptor [Rhodospirillales bacterium]
MVPAAGVHAETAADVDFSELNLEQLMDVDVVQVTSVSRQTRPIAETAAAAFVISAEDIRRSGATNIPEALRMAPGVEVARIDANKWAVSIRGSNGRFSDKLLVMIDGMSVYMPFSCNVFWDTQDLPLDDIARIEVIRGPGGAIWGANAVNGVINIITKHARDTQGTLVSLAAGSQPGATGTARYGGRIGEQTFYRAFVRGLAQGDSARANGGEIAAADGWSQKQSGFRLDTRTATGDPISLSGLLYRGNYGTTGITAPSLSAPYSVRFDDTGDFSGASLLGNWQHELSKHSALETRAFYRRDNRKEQGLIFNLDTFDVDVFQRYTGFRGHELSAGVGYRFIDNRVDGTFALSVDPEERRDHLFSAFVQDEISLVPDQLRLTLGAKLEHNASTGFEIQPSVRTIWTPTGRQAVWAAASRAVRTPTIADDDAILNRQVLPPSPSTGPLPVLVQILGDRDLEPIELYALESGYRIQPTQTLSLDFAAFLNIYDNLRSFSAGPARYEGEPSPGYFVVPFTAGNASKGTSHGFEAAARWTATPWWRLDLAYTYIELDLQDPGDLEGQKAIQGTSPRHQASLRSTMDLGSGWEFDLWPRYVADLESVGVDAYVDLDARLGWRLAQGVDLSLVGQNLLGGPNQGFTPELLPMTPTQQNRVVYGRLTLRF